jgi:hypothetical protein
VACCAAGDCDDGTGCTDDTCVDGVCRFTPNDANCPAEMPFCFGESTNLGPFSARGLRGCIDPCRHPCNLCSPPCAEQPIETYPDFEDTQSQWATRCGSGASAVVAGVCQDGTRFVDYQDGRFGEARFFGGNTGAFVALLTQSDCHDALCLGRGYWPVHMECAGAVVTEVLCGTLFHVGDQIEVPFSP